MVHAAPILMVITIVHTLLPSAVERLDTQRTDSQYRVFFDDFETGRLDTTRWQRTQEGDFKEANVEVMDVELGDGVDYRLRVQANTMGTHDDTVKFLGVRSVEPIVFTPRAVVSFDLDWNQQTNGCYLTAAVYLCPTATSKNPRDEADWLKFEYVGVPPGKKARSVVARKTRGRVQYLHRDGWPEDRQGRGIGNQHIDIMRDGNGFHILENGRQLYRTPSHDLHFDEVYIYLQMSSHSNYPSREVYFDNITISE